MKKSTIGLILIVVGVILAILSLAADLIGIGDNPVTYEIGWKQLVGVGVGVIAAAAGIWYRLKSKK